jgi:hypothetical protein
MRGTNRPIGSMAGSSYAHSRGSDATAGCANPQRTLYVQPLDLLPSIL